MSETQRPVPESRRIKCTSKNLLVHCPDEPWFKEVHHCINDGARQLKDKYCLPRRDLKKKIVDESAKGIAEHLKNQGWVFMCSERILEIDIAASEVIWPLLKTRYDHELRKLQRQQEANGGVSQSPHHFNSPRVTPSPRTFRENAEVFRGQSGSGSASVSSPSPFHSAADHSGAGKNSGNRDRKRERSNSIATASGGRNAAASPAATATTVPARTAPVQDKFTRAKEMIEGRRNKRQQQQQKGQQNERKESKPVNSSTNALNRSSSGGSKGGPRDSASRLASNFQGAIPRKGSNSVGGERLGPATGEGTEKERAGDGKRKQSEQKRNAFAKLLKKAGDSSVSTASTGRKKPIPKRSSITSPKSPDSYCLLSSPRQKRIPSSPTLTSSPRHKKVPSGPSLPSSPRQKSRASSPSRRHTGTPSSQRGGDTGIKPLIKTEALPFAPDLSADSSKKVGKHASKKNNDLLPAPRPTTNLLETTRPARDESEKEKYVGGADKAEGGDAARSATAKSSEMTSYCRSKQPTCTPNSELDGQRNSAQSPTTRKRNRSEMSDDSKMAGDADLNREETKKQKKNRISEADDYASDLHGSSSSDKEETEMTSREKNKEAAATATAMEDGSEKTSQKDGSEKTSQKKDGSEKYETNDGKMDDCPVDSGQEAAVRDALNYDRVPLSSIIGTAGIVLVQAEGEESPTSEQMKERSRLCSNLLPPWPARVAHEAESKQCLEEYWDAGIHIPRDEFVCVYVFFPPPTLHNAKGTKSSRSSKKGGVGLSKNGPNCQREFVHVSRLCPFKERERERTFKSSLLVRDSNGEAGVTVKRLVETQFDRAWNVAGGLRRWALGSNMPTNEASEDEPTSLAKYEGSFTGIGGRLPHSIVGDYGAVFSIEANQWRSASEKGVESVLNLIVQNKYVKRLAPDYCARTYSVVNAAWEMELRKDSIRSDRLGESNPKVARISCPKAKEATLSNVLEALGGDDDDDDDDDDDIFSSLAESWGDVIQRLPRNENEASGRNSKATASVDETDKIADEVDTSEELKDIVGRDGIVMVSGNDPNRSIHRPWPARIACASESAEHRRHYKLKQRGRAVPSNLVCIFYFLPCWGEGDGSGIVFLPAAQERWYQIDFVEPSRIHEFTDKDIDLPGVSGDIIERYKRAWTIAAGLKFFALGLNQDELSSKKQKSSSKKSSTKGCPLLGEILDYGPILKIEDRQWIEASKTLNPDALVRVINKALDSKGIVRFEYSEEKSIEARGSLGNNYAWLKGEQGSHIAPPAAGNKNKDDGDRRRTSDNSVHTARSNAGPSRANHNLFTVFDATREEGREMTNGGVVRVKTEITSPSHINVDECIGNDQTTREELHQIQSWGVFYKDEASQHDISQETLAIFQDIAGVNRRESIAHNGLAEIVKRACNRMLELEKQAKKHSEE